MPRKFAEHNIHNMKTTLIVGGLVVLIALLLSWNRIFPAASPAVLITDPNNLPGIKITDVPWSPEIANLHSRLADIGLSALSAEGGALPKRQPIAPVINGDHATISSDIRVNAMVRFFSPVHTHDTNGVVHVESNIVRDFTLGQFFDIWGVRFDLNCIGGYCTDATHTLRVYANGSPISGDPRNLVLAAHPQIGVVYGDAARPPAVPPNYTLPSAS